MAVKQIFGKRITKIDPKNPNYIPADDMSQFDDGATGDDLGDSGMDDGGFDFDIGF